MNLKELAEYMQGRGMGVQGKTLFVNEMPDSCKEGILIQQRGGSDLDPYLIDYSATEFRLTVRSTQYEPGMEKARGLVRDLRLPGGFETPSMKILQCYPLHTPAPYRRSVGAFWEFETTFAVSWVDLAA